MHTFFGEQRFYDQYVNNYLKCVTSLSCIIFLLYGCEGRPPEPIEVYYIGEGFDL